MKDDSVEVNEMLSFEEMKAFHESGKYRVNVSNEFHITNEMSAIHAVLPTLYDRKWTLHVSNEQNGEFVTTDRPALLTYLNPGEMPPLLRNSPGHGMGSTELLFPVTPYMALRGLFEAEEGTVAASPAAVAAFNAKMIAFCRGQVYSLKKTISYLIPETGTYRDRHFFERWEAYGRSKQASNRLE